MFEANKKFFFKTKNLSVGNNGNCEIRYHFPVDLESFKEIIKDANKIEYYSDFYFDNPKDFYLMQKNWWLISRVTSHLTVKWYLRKCEKYDSNSHSVQFTVVDNDKEILRDLGLDENKELTLTYLCENGYYAVAYIKNCKIYHR